MEIKASLNYYRMAPRKMRLVADLIRGKSIEEARIQLSLLSKRAAQPISKLLESAISNAKNNFGVKEENINNFYIKIIFVNEGPKLKRWRPVARGSAHEIQKKTSHITLILSDKPKSESFKSQKDLSRRRLQSRTNFNKEIKGIKNKKIRK